MSLPTISGRDICSVITLLLLCNFVFYFFSSCWIIKVFDNIKKIDFSFGNILMVVLLY